MDLSGSWKYIQEISMSRLASNKTPHHVYGYGIGIEMMGAAGEICARRFLGLPEELHIGFDGGADLVLNGIRVDVKTTMLTPKISYRFLQWPLGKICKADVVLMAAVDPISKCGTVIGYATRDEIDLADINYKRAQPCKEIRIGMLHSPFLLMERKMAVIGCKAER